MSRSLTVSKYSFAIEKLKWTRDIWIVTPSGSEGQGVVFVLITIIDNLKILLLEGRASKSY